MSKIDIAILVIILFFTAVGYYKGIIGTAFKLIQFGITVYFSIVLSPYVSKFLVSVLNIDALILKWVYSHPEWINGKISEMSEEFLQSITARLINVVSLILLLIVLNLICTLVFSLLNKITKLPILNEVNKLGGILIGMMEGILIVYVAIIVINWLPVSSVDFIKQQLPDSFIASKINACVPAVANEIKSLIKI